MMETVYESNFEIEGSSLNQNHLSGEPNFDTLSNAISSNISNFDDSQIWNHIMKSIKFISAYRTHQSIYPIFDMDFSSVNPKFRQKNDTFLLKKGYNILEDHLNDIIVPTRPKRTYSVNLKIKSRRKAEINPNHLALDTEDYY